MRRYKGTSHLAFSILAESSNLANLDWIGDFGVEGHLVAKKKSSWLSRSKLGGTVRRRELIGMTNFR